VAKEDLPCLLVQRMMRFNMADRSTTDWLYLNLNRLDFILHLSSGMTGSDLPHVTSTTVAEYAIGLPTLEEQRVITGGLVNCWRWPTASKPA
jgi:type I restriction enzyme, S subunit